MNTDIFETVTNLVKNGDAGLVVAACFCCILTGIVKKLSNKTATDLTHSFDICTIAPFIFGVLLSLASIILFGQDRSGGAIYSAIEKGLCIGALSTAIYKLWQSVDKSSLKQLCKDDLFNLFYTQLLTFSDTAQRLISGETTLKEIIGEVQTLTTNATKIYQDKDTQDKQTKLAELMKGIFDDKTVETLLPQLTLALEKYFNLSSES